MKKYIHGKLTGTSQPLHQPHTHTARHSISKSHSPHCITQVYNPTHTHTHTAATSPTKHMHTCKYKCMLSPESALTCISTHTRTSLFPWLSSLVQVGRLESGGRLNLSTLLTIIVWQQTYRVKHNFTSSQMPQQGLIDPAWHHRGQWNGEGKLQSSADLAPDWGQIAIRNGFG